MDQPAQQQPELEGKSIASHADGQAARRVFTLDVAKYERYLEGEDLSEDQKRQLIEAFWAIVVGFVDLGFNVMPESEFCGQDRIEDGRGQSAAAVQVESKNGSLKKGFEKAAAGAAKKVQS